MIVFAYACLRRELQALVARQPNRGTLPNADDIHQIRIATRRLRVALRMFRHVLPAKRAAAFRKDLRRLARALGEVRDLDVYAESFRTYLASVPAERLPEFGGYELHLRRAHSAARNDLGSLFATDEHTQLLASLETFVDGAPSLGALRRWQSFRIRDAAEKYLHNSRRRVLKLGRRVRDHTRPKALHRLRIRAKRLRYELEFFREIYPALGEAAKGAKALQDALGEYQDACTATQRLEEYGRTLRRSIPGATTAVDELLASQKHKADEARRAFPAEWRRFEQILDRTELTAS
jgi:CHAD domain-containing protein